MEKIIFLEELFFEKMWGGTLLQSFYKDKYEPKEIPLGEVWGVSGHRNGVTAAKSGKYSGENLNTLWNTYPKLFGKSEHSNEEFPFQIRLVDAKKKLSVQVHPDEIYAQKNAHDHGKNEAWFILKCQKNASLIYGQKTKSRDELEQHISNKTIDDIIQTIPINKNDFIYVPTGTVHAIGDETFLIEVAECSDTTYRFYDYNRKDQKGEHRELHIDESLDVINFQKTIQSIEQKVMYGENFVYTCLLDKPEFTIEKITTKNNVRFQKTNPYYACYVIEGNGKVCGEKVAIGDFFIATAADKTIEIEGALELLFVYKKERS